MELRDLVDGALGASNPAELRGDPHVAVTGLTHDSRRVSRGDVFCCVPGARVDGLDFASEAVRAGAAALLVERFAELDVPQVRVPDVRAAMGPLASRIHDEPSSAMTVLGVTGTNGKTTTTYLLEAVARAAGLTPGVIGTVETRIAGTAVRAALTTPEAPDLHALLAEMRDRGVGVVAMEVSSHALVQRRVDGVRFAAATFLNLSHDHLDFHGSLDEYFAAKAMLFDADRTAAAAINIDDPRGAVLAARCRSEGIETVTWGVADGAAEAGEKPDVFAGDVVLDPAETRFTLSGRAWPGRQEIRTPLAGAFNVANAVAAAATAVAAGLPSDAVVEGLATTEVVPGRFERVDRGQDFTALVDYAHTPDALAAVLRSARGLTSERVLVVFGCGGDRDRDKRPVMGEVAAREGDVVVVTSDNPRGESPPAIVDDIVAGIPPETDLTVEIDRRAAIVRAVRMAKRGDVVVVAGKGHETGQTVGDQVRPFDDRDVLGAAIDARLAGEPHGARP